MIYLKDKQTNEIKTFEVDNYLQLIKSIRDQYIETTQDEIDTYLLLEAKKVKTAEIEKLKSIELYKHIDYLGTKFVSSEKANSNILGAIILNHRSYDWVDVYGRPKKVNIEELKGLATLIAQQRGITYNKVATKLRALHFAKSIKEVNDINW
tara:strand:- start:477 stop:932 length:456 start_codon:yes stop_codon:yes gene_type:complete